jgi:polyphosphate kinase 2
VNKKLYKSELKLIQKELVHLQRHIELTGQKVVILFEGRDSSGKGGMIKRLVQRLNPRYVHVHAMGKPTPEELKQRYFTKWKNILPKEGEIAVLDRSWYSRAGVESVMNFATPAQVTNFLNSVNSFEGSLQSQGIIVIKYWLSITHQEQEKRFHARLNNLRKRWKLSAVDVASRPMYDLYTDAKERMFRSSHTEQAPWNIINSNDKRASRLTCFTHLISQFKYEIEDYEPRTLPSVAISIKVNKEFDHMIINSTNKAEAARPIS